MKNANAKLPDVAPSPAQFIDHFLRYAGLIVVLGLWILVLVAYGELPEQVPMHFDAAGNPDRWGDKAELFMLPALATLMYGFMAILSKFPRSFNYPVRITATNAAFQYRLGLRLIDWISFSVPLLFGVGMIEIMSIAMGRGPILGGLLLPLLVGFVLIPVVYFVWKAFRGR